MSYVTFEIIGNTVEFTNPQAWKDVAKRKARILEEADITADAYVDSGADCDEKGNYDWDEQEYGADLSFLEE